MQQIYTPKQNYKVLVHTITYNQAKYITDTLDGVAMQQTNFPLVHYVIDDCSTDGEQEVIKAWLSGHCDMTKAEYIDLELANVILVPHKTNTNLTFAIYLLKRNLWKEPELKGTLVKPWRDHCEYEALCEGDDYWIDTEKLQRQVEYLDSHSEVLYSCTRFEILIQNTGEKSLGSNYYYDNPDHASESEFLFTRDDAFTKGWITKTPTCLYRTYAFDQEWLKQFKYSRDVHMVYSILSHGNGVCHNFISSVYRKNDGGIFGSMNNSNQYLINYFVYKELFQFTGDLVIKNLVEFFYLNILGQKFYRFPTTLIELKVWIKYLWSIPKIIVNKAFASNR